MLLPLFATSVTLIPELTCVLKCWKLMSHMSYESLTLSSWFFQVDPSCSHKAWWFDEAFSSFFILITELLSFLFLSANSASHWFWEHLTIWKVLNCLFSSYIHNLCSSSVINSWLERVPKTLFYLNPRLNLYSTCLIGFLKHTAFTLQLNATADVILFFSHCSANSSFIKCWNVTSWFFSPLFIFHFSHQSRLFWIYFFPIVWFLWMSLSPRCRHIFLVLMFWSSCHHLVLTVLIISSSSSPSCH